MPPTINIYCDESCHLENDQQKVMVLGAVWCPYDKKDEIFERIREIKVKHELKKDFEIKWTKVSESKVEFYLELVDYFFDDDDLHFRALVVPDKTILKHKELEQDHDTWYYKMYFSMLKVLIDPHTKNRIFIDIKDTRSSEKIKKLHKVLCNEKYDFNREIIEIVQTVRSHEIELLQITDLLIGAVSYINRGLNTNTGKLKVIERIKKRSNYSLTLTTYLKENKFNILIWQPRRNL
ncbi:MAG TPA: DUF3800 domain-containing protein [Ignavibacteriaceae bacterium]|jgi:hypothetical protein|nr:MAG: hypothetical protein BWY38_00542 [Ignavibacteria bacterium ADurb.Bin266]OQY73450.1 MAG: hypothetical protein B6D44_07330 [Ignavibacteriales bacterium UTCHB2]HQF42397.1 DUF3800 domain-containing protein [Ignavibacteriaceae bacterium]HQI39621.1 DUF3800 domain-containing protein [Ignavibacteriaceae bacterium]